MQGLLTLSRGIDWVNEKIAIIANWLVLICAVVSTLNAAVRYMLDYSWFRPFLPLFKAIDMPSNGWLEAQWYMFAGMVLLGAPYVLKVNEHVRVDLIYGFATDKWRNRIDLFGHLFFLFPMCILLIWITYPWFYDSWRIGEQSSNAGGLVRWPVKLMLPLGFALLAVQGVSELIKTVAAMIGVAQIIPKYERPLQ